MKHVKRILAFALTFVMAFANTLPALAATLDDSISISGLEAGDQVSFYQVLKFNADATKTGGWVNATGFSLTDAEIQQILQLDNTGKYVENPTDSDAYGIGEVLAAKIADMAESVTAKYPNIVASSNTATQASPEAGLYYAAITPGKVGTVYNPVFVGADYASNTTNTWAVTMTDSYSPASMAKKGEITLSKTAEDATTVDTNKENTVAVGDEITFTVATKIPEFASNYTNAVFKVSDTLDTTGLTFTSGSLVITAPTGLTENKDYTLTENKDRSGFVLSFDSAYLLGLGAATDVTIQYKATVTSDAAFSVNEFDNNVTVNYSNNPTDETGSGVLKDKTKHYTFDIDSALFGEDEYQTTEVVKIGLDASGNEITETKILDNGYTVGALQGAKFKLYKDAACTEQYGTTEYVTDESGHIKITGLDAGVYYLKETEAPAGYIKHQDAVKVEIIATLGEVELTETINNQAVTYKYNELTSYKVMIDDVETASYTLTNKSDGTGIQSVDKGDTIVGADGLIGADGAGANAEVGKITNTKGTELPSTGGIGTTIFYVVGGIMVAGAVIFLLTKRRMVGAEG